MGEVSNSLIVVLAVAVIVVSAIGTWVVMDITQEALAGIKIPVLSSEKTLHGSVAVTVNGTEIPITQNKVITGKISVIVNGTE